MEEDEKRFNEYIRGDRYLIDDLSRESWFAGSEYAKGPPYLTIPDKEQRIFFLKKELAERIEFLRIHIVALETKIIALEMENKINERS